MKTAKKTEIWEVIGTVLVISYAVMIGVYFFIIKASFRLAEGRPPIHISSNVNEMIVVAGIGAILCFLVTVLSLALSSKFLRLLQFISIIGIFILIASLAIALMWLFECRFTLDQSFAHILSLMFR